MICTTAYSNYVSTLAVFSDEIEKEEAGAFKTYLQQGIVNFAEVDNSSLPSQIPTHSRPAKCYGYESERAKSVE